MLSWEKFELLSRCRCTETPALTHSIDTNCQNNADFKGVIPLITSQCSTAELTLL